MSSAPSTDKHNGKSSACDVKEGVIDSLQKMSRKLCDNISSAGEKVTHAKESATTQVRSHPLRSTVVALGVGYVLGKLISN